MGGIAAVFAYEIQLDDEALIQFVIDSGLFPGAFSWSATAASLFVHTDWLLAAANLAALWIFGPTIEDRMGHARFLAFYFVTGFSAATAQAWLAPHAAAPLVGAGGAVAGLLAAYLALFPFSRVLVLVFLVTKLDIIEIPAAFFAGLWLMSQLAGGAGRLTEVPATGIPFWWYTGGLAGGLLTVWIFRRRDRLRVEWWS
jgi:membrane associated rhomboid family serine protease